MADWQTDKKCLGPSAKNVFWMHFACSWVMLVAWSNLRSPCHDNPAANADMPWFQLSALRKAGASLKVVPHCSNIRAVSTIDSNVDGNNCKQCAGLRQIASKGMSPDFSQNNDHTFSASVSMTR